MYTKEIHTQCSAEKWVEVLLYKKPIVVNYYIHIQK